MYSSYDSFTELLDIKNNEIIRLSLKDDRIAIAILLYSAVQADGRIRPEETILYRNLLDNYLNISEDEFIAFEELVSETCKKPDSINSIIQIVQNMPETKRREVLELMKDISLSDNMLHEFEVNLVAKMSTLLGLDN